MVERNALLLSAQRALLFAVSPALRFISIEASDRELRMRVHMMSEPSEDERDMYFAMSGEIIGDFPELDVAQSGVEFVVDMRPFEQLEHLKYLVFAIAD